MSSTKITLMDVCQEAVHSLRENHTPQWHLAMGKSLSLPLSKDDQDELFRRLNAKFYAWTGKDIRQYKL